MSLAKTLSYWHVLVFYQTASAPEPGPIGTVRLLGLEISLPDRG